MPVRQYVYFRLSSKQMSAAEMTEWLGVEPDAVLIRGSRVKDPMVPVSHAWKLECREPGLTVDEQISRVLARLRPHLDKIVELARHLRDGEPDCGAVLQVVRYFNADNEQPEPENTSRTETRDAPNLFGWHLGYDVLSFLAQTGAVLDVDEYDLSDG